MLLHKALSSEHHRNVRALPWRAATTLLAILAQALAFSSCPQACASRLLGVPLSGISDMAAASLQDWAKKQLACDAWHSLESRGHASRLQTSFLMARIFWHHSSIEGDRQASGHFGPVATRPQSENWRNSLVCGGEVGQQFGAGMARSRFCAGRLAGSARISATTPRSTCWERGIPLKQQSEKGFTEVLNTATQKPARSSALDSPTVRRSKSAPLASWLGLLAADTSGNLEGAFPTELR